jgi:hypothetical protein
MNKLKFFLISLITTLITTAQNLQITVRKNFMFLLLSVFGYLILLKQVISNLTQFQFLDDKKRFKINGSKVLIKPFFVADWLAKLDPFLTDLSDRIDLYVDFKIANKNKFLTIISVVL